MPWNTPVTWATNQLVTAADLNGQLRDNMSYLHSGKSWALTYKNTGGPYSTTSSSLVDIDGATLVATLNLTTGRVLVTVSGSFYADSAAGRLLTLAVDIDGASHYIGKEALSTDARIIGASLLLGPLSQGAHTFKLRWSVSLGVAYAFSDATGLLRFSVLEF